MDGKKVLNVVMDGKNVVLHLDVMDRPVVGLGFDVFKPHKNI